MYILILRNICKRTKGLKKKFKIDVPSHINQFFMPRHIQTHIVIIRDYSLAYLYIYVCVCVCMCNSLFFLINTLFVELSANNEYNMQLTQMKKMLIGTRHRTFV